MNSSAPLQLYVVCDGPRDHAAACRLAERLIGRPIVPECSQWPRLHRRGSGRGYGRKLKYAVRQAIADRREGVIATVDQDKHDRRAKLKELRIAREEDRATGRTFPTALGEAAPHFEAWLLDDPVAVRAALALAPDTEILPVNRAKDPKATLNDLVAGAIPDRQGREAEILAEVAVKVEIGRCSHAVETGFREFVEEIRAEFASYATGNADS